METNPVTLTLENINLETYEGIYVALKSTSYMTYVTRLQLTPEIINEGAVKITGVAKGEKFAKAQLDIETAFTHPMVIVLNGDNNIAVFMTLTHSHYINTTTFETTTRFIYELDPKGKYKAQYMSEVFFSLDIPSFIEALNNSKFSFKDGKEPDKVKTWVSLPEVTARMKALTEYSLASEALLNKVIETTKGVNFEPKLTRFDSESGDYLVTDYRTARILNNLPSVDGDTCTKALLKLKKIK